MEKEEFIRRVQNLSGPYNQEAVIDDLCFEWLEGLCKYVGGVNGQRAAALLAVAKEILQ